MPSKSKSQQRFFGMVDAYKKGELKHPSKNIKNAAKNMSMKQVKDFAETKHKNLPNKVDEHKTIKITETTLHNIIEESVKNILNEFYNTDSDAFVGGGLKPFFIDDEDYYDDYVPQDKENLDTHMPIDEICDLLGGGEQGYHKLNMILFSLQEQGVLDFNEDALDKLYNAPNY